jgi:hypothetical protein
MNCTEFFRLYSDIRDRAPVEHRLVRRWEQHRRRCSECARRLEVMERGVEALRISPEISPSEEFGAALNRRLRSEVSVGDPITPTHAGIAVAFLLAAAVGLFAYEGLSRPPVTEPPIATRSPESAALTPSDDSVPPPDMVDVTLPPFAHSTLKFHSSQEPLGTFADFPR